EQMLGRSTSQCTPGTDMMVDGINQGTGTPAEFGNAPVNKYFCNIMNAMGLRADTNGFPAVDGPSSEVTHFGYSDKTEDFCGGAGAVTGATIHDPGGFSELKA
ncbi:MAG TPA: Tat pathway signal sequence, partial [Polyangiaceae bacterium]|nr:Tat pathway signal sequence [Polyangiaceae bacterium]